MLHLAMRVRDVWRLQMTEFHCSLLLEAGRYMELSLKLSHEIQSKAVRDVSLYTPVKWFIQRSIAFDLQMNMRPILLFRFL